MDGVPTPRYRSGMATPSQHPRLTAADLATLEKAQHATQAAATHEEAKPENDKDTRALEQSYLARGQALELFPGRSDVFDLVLAPRFRRILDEFCPRPGGRVLPFRRGR